MKVTLKRYTADALELLLETKNTRLANSENPCDWSDERKGEELSYMLDTIKSSWEFIDYVFKIEGVTRSFTQQLERTRSGSYAEKTLRAVDVRDLPVKKPGSIPIGGELENIWLNAVDDAIAAYSALIDRSIPIQDARGVLPINIETELFAKFNLRTLSDMAKLRLCVRTQGEYQDVFRLIREEVLSVHHWAEDFLQVHCVSTGTCAFPRYGKTACPFYDARMDLTGLKEDTKKKFWSIRHEAKPEAKNGRTL